MLENLSWLCFSDGETIVVRLPFPFPACARSACASPFTHKYDDQTLSPTVIARCATCIRCDGFFHTRALSEERVAANLTKLIGPLRYVQRSKVRSPLVERAATALVAQLRRAHRLESWH